MAKKEQNSKSRLNKFLITGAATLALMGGATGAQAQGHGWEMPGNPLHDFKVVSYEICVPQNIGRMTMDFNKQQIESAVDFNLRQSQTANWIINNLHMEQRQLCLRDTIMVEGSSMLGAQGLDNIQMSFETLENAKASFTVRLAYQLASHYLNQQGGITGQSQFGGDLNTYPDRMRGIMRDYHNHRVHRLASWAIAVRMLEEMKDFGNDKPWQIAKDSGIVDAVENRTIRNNSSIILRR